MKLSLVFNGLVAVTAATSLVLGNNSVNCAISTGLCLGFLNLDILNPVLYYYCMDEIERNHPECEFFSLGKSHGKPGDSNPPSEHDELDKPSGDPDLLDLKCTMLHGGCIGKCGGLRKDPPCIRNCKERTLSVEPRCKNHRFPPVPQDSKRELPEVDVEPREEHGINFFPAPEPTGNDLCDKCREDYRFCVEAAYIPGLPSCEGICKKHTLQKDSTCDSCDQDQYFPSYKLEKPAVEHQRT